MADNSKKGDSGKNGSGKKRGTIDELETIKVILEEHQYIKKMVLDALKKYEKESKETVFDKVNAKLNNSSKGEE